MLNFELLTELGLAEDRGALLARLVRVAEAMNFGLVSAALTRGSPWSAKQTVRWVGNTPEAFVQASVSVANVQRDPVMTQLQRRSGPLVYDQSTYVAAGAADLWEMQAPFGYRNGVAGSLHAGTHEETFVLGIDRPDGLPADSVGRFRLMADMQLVLVHAHAAACRVLMPPDPNLMALPQAPLAAVEHDSLAWTAEGMSVWQTSEKLNLTVLQTRGAMARAAHKLGERTVKAAQLRVIRGGKAPG